jgi:hypothetical protein
VEQNQDSTSRYAREAAEFKSIQRRYVANARRTCEDSTRDKVLEIDQHKDEGVQMKHLLEFDPRLESEELEAAMNGHKYKKIIDTLEAFLVDQREDYENHGDTEDESAFSYVIETLTKIKTDEFAD